MGAESIEQTVKQFSSDPDTQAYFWARFFENRIPLLESIISGVENGEFEKDLYNKFLQKEFGDLKLVDFLQLLDSSPSINVTGLRAIHKLLVFPFSCFLLKLPIGLIIYFLG